VQYIEIEQETEAAEPKVAEYLSHMDWQYLINRLELNHDTFIDQEVQSIPSLKEKTVVANRNWNLAADRVPSVAEFVG
jgi:hypothetical protein